MALTALRYDVEKFAVSIVGRCERAIFPMLTNLLADNGHIEPFRQCLSVFSDEMESWKREAQETLRKMLTSKVEQVVFNSKFSNCRLMAKLHINQSVHSESRIRE